MRRVLLLLSQFPHDPSSGAALTMLSVARMLAGAGFDVRSLSPSASEGAQPVAALSLLTQLGCDVKVDRRGAVGKGCPVLKFQQSGVRFEVMDTGPCSMRDFDFRHGVQFTRLLERTLDEFRPDIVYTFGGTPPDQQRRQFVREGGAIVVFHLHNLSYLHPLAFDNVDAVITPSEFLAKRYREQLGLESTPIPPAMETDEIVCPVKDRQLLPPTYTFVNPTPAKGVFFFVRLADFLLRKRSDIHLQVIQARGTATHLFQAALNGNFDLRVYKHLHVLPTLARPRDVFRNSRAVLVPSVAEEGFGRLAAEACLNGVPAIVSDRGGLPEAAGGAGIVLPLPAGLLEATLHPVNADSVKPWVEAIERLTDAAAFYRECCEAAIASSQRFRPEVVAPRYVAFFEGVRKAEGPLVAQNR